MGSFVASLLRPWPPGKPESDAQLLAVSNLRREHVSSYDNALVALYLLRQGERARAARVLSALAALQMSDGAVPFSFAWPQPDVDNTYVRSGATAWVGYAAVEYLNADRAGPDRDVIVRLAYRAADYLLAHQITQSDDPRNGLVLGGFGTYRYEPTADGGVEERYVAESIDWASTEHNIDTYFFLRDFGALTGKARFANAAGRIREALLARGWSDAAGQLVRGISVSGADKVYALDCASWGSLFLLAAGDSLRSETAFATADVRYAARENEHGATGHRPYAHGPLLESRILAEHLRGLLPENWDQVQAVWPEGSAGVALTALRNGRETRARFILAELEKLRTDTAGLPMFTLAIPGEFDTDPSLAGTLWVELVRFELARGADNATLWRP